MTPFNSGDRQFREHVTNHLRSVLKLRIFLGMARLGRLVIPGMPHDITFFNEADYAAYLALMAEWCRQEGGDMELLPDRIARKGVEGHTSA